MSGKKTFNIDFFQKTVDKCSADLSNAKCLKKWSHNLLKQELKLDCDINSF